MTGRDKPPSPEEIEQARKRFVDWVLFWESEYSDEIPTRTELARRIGVEPSTITMLLKKGLTRAPSFATLLGFAKLTGHPIDFLLSHDPPPRRR